jgi:hypothetical protein
VTVRDSITAVVSFFCDLKAYHIPFAASHMAPLHYQPQPPHEVNGSFALVDFRHHVDERSISHHNH